MKCAIIGVLLTLFTFHAGAQAGGKIEFEVASVRAVPVQPGRTPIIGMRGGPGTSDPTHVSIENYPMILLVLEAYNLNFFQVSGVSFAPEKYIINANMAPGTTKGQYRLMLQQLLAERFRLKVHRESREMPIYEMSVARNAPPLKQHTGELVLEVPDRLTLESSSRDKDGFPLPDPGGWGVSPAPDNRVLWRFNLPDLDLREFATNLSSRLGRTIVDATGLKGRYDFVLSAFVEKTPPAPLGDASPPPPVNNNDFQIQQLIAAIQKQLGLKLEPKKGPVDMLVVDHFEKVPTEN